MTSLKQLFSAALLASAALAGPVLAQAAGDMTDAEVRKVDADKRQVTLKHGEIKNLGMPPMAMTFEVKDAAMLAKLKAGDKVRFKAVHEGGKYIVTELQPAKK